MSNGPLSRGWFDANCRHAEDVDESMYETNADRAEARTKAKLGIG